MSEAKPGELLGTLEYSFEQAGVTAHKRVDYFLFTATQPGPLGFGAKSARTKEVSWITEADAQALPLVSEGLRPIIFKAFALHSSGQGRGG